MVGWGGWSVRELSILGRLFCPSLQLPRVDLVCLGCACVLSGGVGSWYLVLCLVLCWVLYLALVLCGLWGCLFGVVCVGCWFLSYGGDINVEFMGAIL